MTKMCYIFDVSSNFCAKVCGHINNEGLLHHLKQSDVFAATYRSSLLQINNAIRWGEKRIFFKSFSRWKIIFLEGSHFVKVVIFLMMLVYALINPIGSKLFWSFHIWGWGNLLGPPAANHARWPLDHPIGILDIL